jgi:hypothetical protein
MDEHENARRKQTAHWQRRLPDGFQDRSVASALSLENHGQHFRQSQ